MPLNATDAELRASAAADLAEKLKLERRQIIELRELFRSMSEDMEAFIAETGQVPDAAIYEDELRGLLARQGRRVSREFSGEVTDFLDEAPEDEDALVDLAAIAAVSGIAAADIVDRIRNNTRRQNAEFVVEQSNADARLITQTNQREMDASVVAARATLIDEGLPTDNADVARIASNDFRNRGFTRSPTIAATYTQKIAESAKKTEFDEFMTARNGLSAVSANIPQAEEVEVWVTMGDERVRAAHIAADFKRSQNGGWVVGGEFLRFPGDPFRGSAANIINCRCSAKPVIE